MGSPTDLTPGSPWGTDVPSSVTNGEHVFGHPFDHSSQASITRKELTPVMSHLAIPVAPAPSSGMKQQCQLPDPVACSPQPADEVAETSEEPPHQKQKDGMSLKKLLKGGQQEAFARDSSLVQQAMEAYFRMNQPEFGCKFSCDLAGLFQEIIASAGLLDSQDLQNPGSLDQAGGPLVCQ